MTVGHHPTRRTARTTAVVLGLTGGLLGGSGVLGSGAARADNGIDTLSARQIAERSRDALLSVDSLRVTARGDLGDGRPAKSLDVVLDRSGDCVGSVRLGGGQGSARIVKHGDEVWVKPDADFWKSQVPDGGAAFAAILNGRYLRAPASDPRLRPLTEGCDPVVFEQLAGDVAHQDPAGLRKAPRTTLDGAPVVPLTSTREGRTWTTYVAATGRPFPVRITVHGGGADAVVGLSGFGKPVPSATPPPDRTYDINALLGRSSVPT
ncbi:hypothetical protein ACFV97_06955 [Streptomyces sp. NPDC059913]|uniref:hypothetical protein n=1 Tax=unclassified Streptomyces TaxID=2593676 RepID=UPI0036689C4C